MVAPPEAPELAWKKQVKGSGAGPPRISGPASPLPPSQAFFSAGPSQRRPDYKNQGDVPPGPDTVKSRKNKSWIAEVEELWGQLFVIVK